MDHRKKIKDLNKKFISKGTLDKEEINFLFDHLESKNLKLASSAALILTDLGLPTFKLIFERFDHYHPDTQKILVTFFTCSTEKNVYEFLIHYLKTCHDNELANTIRICLKKTDYIIFPLVLKELGTRDKHYLKQLLLILENIGFNNIAPYLALMPQIPFEQLFRKVFGNHNIDQIKQ